MSSTILVCRELATRARLKKEYKSSTTWSDREGLGELANRSIVVAMGDAFINRQQDDNGSLHKCREKGFLKDGQYVVGMCLEFLKLSTSHATLFI